MRIVLIFVTSAAVVALAAPGAAAAAPAHAAVQDPADDVPYSFDPQPDVTSIEVTWTDHLVVRVSYAAVPPSPDLSLLVSSAARKELDPSVEQCDADMADSFTVEADSRGAVFQDPYIDGSLSSPAAWNGASVTYTFTSPTLVRKYNTNGSDPFACVDGSARDDSFFGGFDGKHIKLTRAAAEVGVRREMDRRYAAGTRKDTEIRCLDRGAREATDDAAALRWCGFRAGAGAGKVAIGQMAVFLAGGVPQTAGYYVKKFPAGTRECGTTDFSGRWLLAPFPESFGGASMTVWAKRTSCRTARRLASGGRGSRAFRCRTIKSAWEYSFRRCAGRRGRTVWLETAV